MAKKKSATAQPAAEAAASDTTPTAQDAFAAPAADIDTPAAGDPGEASTSAAPVEADNTTTDTTDGGNDGKPDEADCDADDALGDDDLDDLDDLYEPGEPGERYRCVTACRFQNRQWQVGEVLVVTTPTAIPEHFEYCID